MTGLPDGHGQRPAESLWPERWPHVSLPSFLLFACSPKVPSLALWPLHVAPSICPFCPNVGFLPPVHLSPQSLRGRPALQQGWSSILTFPALTWAGPPTMLWVPAGGLSPVTVEGAAVDDAREPVRARPFPGCCLLLHLLAQLLFSDSPRCPRGMVFQNPITAGSRKSLNLPNLELVLLFSTPHWGPF